MDHFMHLAKGSLTWRVTAFPQVVVPALAGIHEKRSATEKE